MASSSVIADILLLGSGWTSRFLLPQALHRGLRVTCTTRSGQHSPHLEAVVQEERGVELDVRAFQLPADDAGGVEQDHAVDVEALPGARMVVVVFPLKSTRTLDRLVKAYESRHGTTNWLQLGSTGAWGSGHSKSSSTIDTSNLRAVTEAHLLSLHDAGSRRTSVLNLAGLYGGARQPVNFAKRVAASREALASKGSLHLLHGRDVAHAVLGMYDALASEEHARRMWGRRWIVTDTHVYDWWSINSALRPFPSSAEWVTSLQAEHSVPSLPRPCSIDASQTAPQYLERSLDGVEFWAALGVQPLCGRCDDDEMIKEAELELENARTSSAL